MTEKIIILDFGSQYTQLIARAVREANVYCELHSWDVDEAFIKDFQPAGIILSGGPASVYGENVPTADLARIVKQCRDLPGQELFQYVDENGEDIATGRERYASCALVGQQPCEVPAE